MDAISRKDRLTAQQEGSFEAVREWVRLDLDPDRPLDIFRIILDTPVVLMFRPLNKAFGFYSRSADGGDIVIHSGHPLALQRYTAAHEYGHHVLGHRHSMDTEGEIFGYNVTLQEIAAQAFAADFLMPLPVVNRALDRLALPQERRVWTGPEVYQLSLELGVSYRATLTQLSALHLIHQDRLVDLRRKQPAEIKATVGFGVRPTNTRADVWSVDGWTSGRWLRLQLDDELCVRAPAGPPSMASWSGEWHGAEGVLQEAARGDGQPDPILPGLTEDSATRHLRWRAEAVGRGVLHIRRRTARAGYDGFELNVEVIERGNGVGLHVLERLQRLERAAAEHRAAIAGQT